MAGFSFNLTSNQRACGTCEYWQGPRRLEYYGTRVFFNDMNDSAKCYVPDNSHQWGPNVAGRIPCGDYKKWSAMK